MGKRDCRGIKGSNLWRREGEDACDNKLIGVGGEQRHMNVLACFACRGARVGQFL